MQGASGRARHEDLFRIGAAAAINRRDLESAMWFAESGRAGSLLDTLPVRDALRGKAIPDELLLAESSARAKLAAAAVVYRAALGRGEAATAQMRGLRQAVDQASARLEDVVERIQREAKKAASVLYPTLEGIEAIRRRLSEGDAFVTFLITSKKAFAVVVEPKGARLVGFGSEEELRAACDALRLDGPSVDPAKTLADLRRIVVEPLRLAPATRRLLLSPDGELAYLPFAALWPDHDLAAEPSATVYGVLADEAAGARGAQVLALGDPSYPVVGTGTSRGPKYRGVGLVPLPATRAEVRRSAT
jgi:hypothetical protein